MGNPVWNVTSQTGGGHIGACLEQTFVWSLSGHRFLFSLFQALSQPHRTSNKIALAVRPSVGSISIFDIVCTVHRNQFYKQTNKMHICVYLFYNIFANLHVSKDYFVHHQEFISLLYLQLCTNRANVSNCSVARTSS